MPSDAAREMTLAEWVDRLPPSHSAREAYLALITSAERLAEAERLLRTVPMLTYTDNERIWKNEVCAFLANASPTQDEVGEIVAHINRRANVAAQLHTLETDNVAHALRSIAVEIERGDFRPAKEA